MKKIVIIGLILFSVALVSFLSWNFVLNKNFKLTTPTEDTTTSEKDFPFSDEKQVPVATSSKNVPEAVSEVSSTPQKEEGIVSKIVNLVFPPDVTANGDVLFINYKVPFTSQAPYAQWDDERYQDGCEEASVLMAVRWVQNKGSISKDEATSEIAKMSEWEISQWGEYRDSAITDTIKIITQFYGHKKAEIFFDITVEDIKKELAAGKIVLVPVDGQKLNNPYFTPPGPEIHMLVIRGFDERKKEFITNDPGTKRGQEFRYSYDNMMSAIRVYNTGFHEPILEIKKAMIVVEK